MLLTQTAMKELRRLIHFTQLRFHCKKQNPGRTIHIATVKNSSGEAVVQYFSGQTDVLPIACGSFYKIKGDNSKLAKKCSRWEKDKGHYHAGKWGHEVDGSLGSDQKETRLFNFLCLYFMMCIGLLTMRGDLNATIIIRTERQISAVLFGKYLFVKTDYSITLFL